MLVIERNTFMNCVRWLFAALDWIIYKIIGVIMNAIIQLSNLEIGADMVEKFSNKIYVIVGVIMLFRLAFSLMQVIVNPELMANKEKGTGKIVQRIMITLIMIVGLPFAFNLLAKAQSVILPAIPKLVLSNQMSDTDAEHLGENMSLAMMQAFYYEEGGKGISDLDNLVSEAAKPGASRDIYKYEYVFGISTIVGGFLIYIIVGIAINVAIRIFKLFVLKMLAPIPIVSYIDPQASKNTFSSWIKTFFSTWIELFLQLGVIYLALYLVQDITSGDLKFFEGISVATNGSIFQGGIILIFLILGIFFFAKQAPKFIKNSLGLKDSGGSLFGVGGAFTLGALAGGINSMASGNGFFKGNLIGGTHAGIEVANASATGKAVGSGWSIGRDHAAQILSGDEKRTGGLLTGLERNLETSARRHNVSQRYGINDATVAEAKKKMIAAQAEEDKWQARYQQAIQSGADSKTVEAYRQRYRAAQVYSQDATKIYNKYDEDNKRFGPRETLASKYADIQSKNPAASYATEMQRLDNVAPLTIETPTSQPTPSATQPTPAQRTTTQPKSSTTNNKGKNAKNSNNDII